MRDVKWTQWGLRNTNLAKHSMKVEGYRLLFCLECLLSAVFLGAAAMEPFRKVLPFMSSQLRSPCENLGSMQFVEMWDPTFKLYGDRRRFAPFTFAKKIIGIHFSIFWIAWCSLQRCCAIFFHRWQLSTGWAFFISALRIPSNNQTFSCTHKLFFFFFLNR